MKKKFFIFLIVTVLLVVGWAPWLNAEDARSIVKTYKNFQEQHRAESEQGSPDMYITWLPFCRWVTTYEGGWFVCFWQNQN